MLVVLEHGEDLPVCGRQRLHAAAIAVLGDPQDGLPGDLQPLQPELHRGKLLTEPGDLLAQAGRLLAASGPPFVELGQEFTHVPPRGSGP
ncbi:hypothetical protein ABT160_46865 [Streptomyces sp. NPDC001941]|uniref:hypothetical protein n=1 Tax=Streptomyces sp. NPDC001941 TaxID=3154659 RepID=UPI00331F7B3A